ALADERAGVRLRHQDGSPSVLDRSDPADDQVIEDDAGSRSPRQYEAPDSEADRCEDLDAFAVVGCVRDDKRAVGRHRKSCRLNDPTGFRADLHDLPCARSRLVDTVHGVTAAVEHEQLARGGWLKAGRLPGATGETRGDG